MRGGGKIENEKESKDNDKRYNYIGYATDLPLGQQKYALQVDLLMKLARECVRKHDYYNAIRYLNMILLKEPRNHTAQFYKKEVMLILDNMKRSRDMKGSVT